METILRSLIQLYLRSLHRLAPRLAGRQGFALFCTPRFRAPVRPEGQAVLDRAERFFLDLDGKAFAGYRWRHPEKGEAAPRVILVHGWESRAGRLIQWVDPLLEAGFEVAAFDAPAHGASEGRRTNPPEFAAALIRLAEELGPVHGLVGHSVGALSSTLAVAGGDLFQRANLQVERMVFLAGAESGVEATELFCRILGLSPAFQGRMLEAVEAVVGQPMASFDGRRLLPSRPVPTLWFHDPEDEEVLIRGAEAVAEVSSHVTLERVEGLGHHRIARDPEVVRRGVEFLVNAGG